MLNMRMLSAQGKRLAEIADVLYSLRLVDRMKLFDSRKLALRWRGCPAPGEVSAALAAKAAGAQMPDHHLQAPVDGAASGVSHGADPRSPTSVRHCIRTLIGEFAGCSGSVHVHLPMHAPTTCPFIGVPIAGLVRAA
jgi:hypothetical protein